MGMKKSHAKTQRSQRKHSKTVTLAFFASLREIHLPVRWGKDARRRIERRSAMCPRRLLLVVCLLAALPAVGRADAPPRRPRRCAAGPRQSPSRHDALPPRRQGHFRRLLAGRQMDRLGRLRRPRPRLGRRLGQGAAPVPRPHGRRLAGRLQPRRQADRLRRARRHDPSVGRAIGEPGSRDGGPRRRRLQDRLLVGRQNPHQRRRRRPDPRLGRGSRQGAEVVAAGQRGPRPGAVGRRQGAGLRRQPRRRAAVGFRRGDANHPIPRA